MPPQPAPKERPNPLAWLNSQLAERPDDAGLWYGRGVILAKEGDLGGALEAFDKVLWLDPDHVKALEAKGRALFRTDQFLEAFAAFQKLTEKVPRDEEYWYYAGECLLREGNPEKAIALYERALEINPNYTDAWYGRGNAIKASGMEGEALPREPEEGPPEPEEAEPELEAILSEAEQALIAQRYEEALALYEEALKVAEDPRAWEGKGKVLTHLGRYSDAASCYERALTGQQDTEKWLRRGRALREAGDLDEALESYDMALRLDPQNLAAEVERKEVLADLDEGATAPHGPLPAPAEDTGVAPVATHVPTLDRALGGGLTPGSLVLVTGMPGTFKTSFCLWVLHQQALYDRTKALFVTLEQSRESLLRHAVALGLDPFRAAEAFRILDLTPYRREFVPKESPEEWLDFLKGELEEARAAGVEIVALDSLAALRSLVGNRGRRDFFRFFDFLRSLEVTAFLVDERLEVVYQGRVLRAYDSVDFLADGILELTMREAEGGEAVRGLRVAKMRDRDHPLRLFRLVWDDGIRLTTALTGPPP